MVKFLRIFSFVTSFPALLFFFYFIIKSLETTGEAGSGRLGTVLVAFVVLFVPVSFNRLAWVIDRGRTKKKL